MEEERQKEQDEVKAEEQEPKVVITWAEELEDTEEKGMDVFVAQNSCLPHYAFVH